MDTHEYETMRRVEDTYWWYQVLHEQVLREIAGRVSGDAAILDAGCGTGGMMNVMRAARPDWKLRGFDASEDAVAISKARGFEDVRLGSVEEPPVGDERFDAVICLDVLYFRGVDRPRAAAALNRVLKPGGVLVLNLPAHECLRGSHDVAVATEKRFTCSEVETLLRTAGFEIASLHGWNAWLFLPILIWRHASRVVAGGQATTDVRSDLRPLPEMLNRLLAAVGRIDAWICKVLSIPFGTSVFSVAIKSKSA